MRTLIVHRNKDLGRVWQRHLERLGVTVTRVDNADCAATLIQNTPFDAIVLDIVLPDGNALALADLAQFKQPSANLVLVTDTTFFSDGSIFQHVANARAFVKTATPPQDLAAIVHHYGSSARDRAAHHSPVPG